MNRLRPLTLNSLNAAPPGDGSTGGSGTPGGGGDTPVPTPTGQTWYVSTTGNDAFDGSVLSPFRTLHRAGEVVNPGDRILIRGGTYFEYNDYSANIQQTGIKQTSFKRSGTAEAPIFIESYPGEWAIFDGSKKPDGSAYNFLDGPSSPYQPYMLYIAANHYVVRNMEWTHSVGNAIHTTPKLIPGTGSNHLFQNLYLHHNHSDGIYAGGRNIDDMATGNRIWDVISHNNGSTRNGGDSADGVKMPFTRFAHINRCIFFKNSDDGMDFFGGIDCLVENSVSWNNGAFWPADDDLPFDRFTGRIAASSGNGNGFKLGGMVRPDYPVTRNTGRNCIAFWNIKLYGHNFNDSNTVFMYNLTSWADKYSYSLKCFEGGIIRNCIAYENPNLDGVKDTEEAPEGDCRGEIPTADHNNFTHLVAGSDPGFLSYDPVHADFMALSDTSAMRGAGVDVGLPFSGAAPDLGALQYGQRITDLGVPALATLSSQAAIRAVMMARADSFR